METAQPEPALPLAKRHSGVIPALVAAVLAGGSGLGVGFSIRNLQSEAPLESVQAAKDEPLEWSWRVNSDSLLAGSFAESLLQIRAAASHLSESDEQALSYRTALALEGLRRFDESLGEFRHAGEHRSRTSITPWALLGEARCLGRDRQFEHARHQVARATLLAGLAGDRSAECLVECLYLRAWLGALERAGHSMPDPLDPREPAWDLDVQLLDCMPRLLTCVASSPSAHIPGEDGNPLRADSQGPHTVTVKLRLFRGSDLFDSVAESVKKPGRVRGAAGSALRELAVEVAAESTPHEILLASLAELAGLDVLVSDRDITIQDAAIDREATRIRHELSVLQALSADTTHPLAPSARLWEANAKFHNDTLEARNSFERILASPAPCGIHACASMNLGLLDFARGKFLEARNRFNDAGDQRSSMAFESLGRWWAGRAHLEEGRFAEARKCLLESLGAPDPELRSAATLGLILRDVLVGRTDAARIRLRDSRVAVLEQHLALAEGFDSWLAFEVNPTAHRRQRAFEAVQRARFEVVLGTPGRYFAGQVFMACGTSERTETLYREPSPRGVFAALMLKSLADAEFERDERESAKSRYTVLVSQEDQAVATHARLRLAELAERAGNGVECEVQARLALASRHADRAAALRLVGRGCELQRRHRAAAEAYSGRIPNAQD